MHKILATHIMKNAEHILILSCYSDDDSNYHEIHILNIMHCYNSFSHFGATSLLQTVHGRYYAQKEFDRYVERDTVHG